MIRIIISAALLRRRRAVLLGVAVLMAAAAGPTRAQDESYVAARARGFEPLMRAAASRHGVDARLLWTIAYLETRFRPALVSTKGARGLMQFMPATARRYDLANPHDPAQSIDAAARYIRDLRRRFGDRLDLILAAYNAGEGAVEAYRDGRSLVLQTGKIINPGRAQTGGVPPYAETRNYVASGLRIFRALNGGGPIVSDVARPAATAIQGASDEELGAIREDSYYVEGADAQADELGGGERPRAASIYPE